MLGECGNMTDMEHAMDHEALEHLALGIRSCDRCPLHEGRTSAVPGEGACTAGVMLVGEAPGEKEDLGGRPFAGRSGEVLDKLLHQAGLEREQLFITSSVKCRPPKNRDPHKRELETCRETWLLAQIEALRPRRIVLLGRVAVRCLLGGTEPLSALRGRELAVQGRPAMATMHPAAALRFPKAREALGQDLAALARIVASG